MMALIIYIAAASVCMSLLYLSFRLIFRDDYNPRYARFYLVCSILLSLMIPLSNARIQTGLSFYNKIPTTITQTTATHQTLEIPASAAPSASKMTTNEILIRIYIAIVFLLVARILLQIVFLGLQYAKSIKIKQNDCTLIYQHRYTSTFSFFRWVFVQPVLVSDDDLDQIIAHEKIHVSQYHSVDLLVIELLSAVMWFNPFVWMMKKSFQLVHEYLADQGALETGIDKIRYQAILVNQVAEERLVCLSSSFNHSIKKRIIMMTKSNIQGRSGYKLIAAVPVAIILFTAMAVFNGMFNEAKASVVPGEKNHTKLSVTHTQKAAPPDTIIKKTITKRISSAHPNDTIIEETEVILTGADAEKEGVQHAHHSKDVFIYTDEDKMVQEHINDGDSIRTVTIIKHSDKEGDEKMMTLHYNHKDMQHSRILYIVDGVEHRESNILEKIDVKDILKVEVVKDENMKKYTSESFDGVILITTKKGK